MRGPHSLSQNRLRPSTALTLGAENGHGPAQRSELFGDSELVLPNNAPSSHQPSQTPLPFPDFPKRFPISFPGEIREEEEEEEEEEEFT